MKKYLVVVLFAVFASCVATKPIVVQNSIPVSDLDGVADTFDTWNQDLWEQFAESSDWQMGEFKMADIAFNGRLVLTTQKGAYSRGDLHSKFHLRGDYDIQIDCEVAINEVRGNMTYNLGIETGTVKEDPSEPWTGAFIEITKEPGSKTAVLTSGTCTGIQNSDCDLKRGRRLDRFNGSLRIVRIGDQIFTMYRNDSASDWITITKHHYNRRDQYVGMGLSNYFLKRKKINAPISLTGTFDNFKVNAAQEIIEDEI